MMLPKPIHEHPRSEWIVRIRDGFGQLQAAATVGEGRRPTPAQHGKKMTRHLFALILRIASHEQRQIARLGTFFQGMREGIFLRRFFLQCVELGPKPRQLSFALLRKQLLHFSLPERVHTILPGERFEEFQFQFVRGRWFLFFRADRLGGLLALVPRAL